MAGCAGCGKNAGCQCAMKVVDTDCVNLTLTGAGSKANPWCITADPILSATADNQLSCEADGLYVPPAPFSVEDTNCINLTFAADVLTADPIIAPIADNVLQCTPTGLYVSGVDTLAVLDTQSVELTLAGGNLSADVLVGCGLDIDGTGVHVNVGGTWGFPCDQSEGADLYCDDNGVLHAEPPRLYEQDTLRSFNDSIDTVVTPGANTPVQATSNNIGNPSTCYDFSLLYTVHALVIADLEAGAAGTARLFVDNVERSQSRFSGDDTTVTFSLFDHVVQVVPAGGATAIAVRVEVENTGTGNLTVRSADIKTQWNGHSS